MSTLADLWDRSRVRVQDRVDVIESAALALRSGPLAPLTRAQARRAAHRIAGVAGTFGYWTATELAREAEAAFRGSDAISAAIASRLEAIVVELRVQLSGDTTD